MTENVLAAIEQILAMELTLGYDGYSAYDPDRTLAQQRERMLLPESQDEFARACAWLEHCGRTTHANPRHTSYGYKHHAEEWSRRTFPDQRYYVSNGMLICAALHLGFESSGIDGANCKLNVSERSMTERLPI